jgi:flagellar biosynthesis anti-sigma factor FlgM
MDRPIDPSVASGRQERVVKIDSYRSNVSNQPPDRVGGAAAPVGNSDTVGAAPAPATGVDDVRLSSDAQLMQAAMRAVQDVPDVRPDVVERMRAALANGAIGNDPHALADAIIDHLLGTPAK